MEEALVEAVRSMAGSGPEWLFAMGLVAVMAWLASKAVPIAADTAQRRADVEAAREERKAEEARRLEQRDLERSRAEGRWLEQYERATRVQEQTNAVMAGVEGQMAALNAALNDSKERAGKMARDLEAVRAAVQQS